MPIKDLLHRLLRHPLLAGYQTSGQDAVDYTLRQRRIIDAKPILQIIYQRYARAFLTSAARAPTRATMLEIGAGISPLKQHIPDLICSDVVRFDWLDLVCSAYALPFADHSLDRIFLMFVLHHLGQVETFLDEVVRCLKPGGELVIQDPTINGFSRHYFKLHVDQCDADATAWGFSGSGRLTDSNVALAWMIFIRDRDKFRRRYPQLEIVAIEYDTCLSFLLSGGLSFRQLLPTALLKALFAAENWLIRHLTNRIAVHMTVVVRRRPD